MSVRSVLPQTDIAAVDAPPVLIDALQSHLASLADLIAAIDVATYRATPSGTSGSIGEHVRHCLDHVKALVACVAGDSISYDSRLRGTSVERLPSLAIEELDRVCRELWTLDDFVLERAIALVTMTHRDAPSTAVETTIGREVAFVIQHTIHHCALVAMLLDRLGIAAPAGFGYAPSTPGKR